MKLSDHYERFQGVSGVPDTPWNTLIFPDTPWNTVKHCNTVASDLNPFCPSVYLCDYISVLRGNFHPLRHQKVLIGWICNSILPSGTLNVCLVWFRQFPSLRICRFDTHNITPWYTMILPLKTPWNTSNSLKHRGNTKKTPRNFQLWDMNGRQCCWYFIRWIHFYLAIIISALDLLLKNFQLNQ